VPSRFTVTTAAAVVAGTVYFAADNDTRVEAAIPLLAVLGALAPEAVDAASLLEPPHALSVRNSAASAPRRSEW
jgi:hypothetical protein